MYRNLVFLSRYIGAWAGGIGCFVLARRWLGDYYRTKLIQSFPKFRAVEEVVETGGLKLVTLIRLAPYPYGIMSVLFATTSVSLSRFIQATSLALFKIILHIYIGSTVRDLSETSQLTPARVFALIFGLSIAGFVMVYLTILVRKVLENAEHHEGGEEGLLNSSDDETQETPIKEGGRDKADDIELQAGYIEDLRP
ncbi:hypothetical protein PhCBS80983_g05393 [Powellomyces hirtus]|uniref:VTT domain-containing protein n=1 Tax=Powellomyces hirtus TaxID=109895 RepID=A0A507DUC2_9FUNG|nr:hypothetical protein PhCBS80983_g05393 [Powellomyces hirtus]